MIKGFPAAFSTRHAGTQPQRTHITHKSHYTRVHDAPTPRSRTGGTANGGRSLRAASAPTDTLLSRQTPLALHRTLSHATVSSHKMSTVIFQHSIKRHVRTTARPGADVQRGSPWFSVVLRPAVNACTAFYHAACTIMDWITPACPSSRRLRCALRRLGGSGETVTRRDGRCLRDRYAPSWALPSELPPHRADTAVIGSGRPNGSRATFRTCARSNIRPSMRASASCRQGAAARSS